MEVKVAKKLFFLFIALLIISGSVVAQGQERAKNCVSIEVGVFGAEASYERIFNKYLSVLADVSYTQLFFMDEFTASGKGRVYPFGGTFYLELGLGYTYGKGVVGFVGDMMLTVLTFGYWLQVKDFENDNYRTGGFLVQPGLGWKIDIGKPDGFVIPISMGLDIKPGDKPDFMPYLRLGLGYSF